MNKIRYFFLHDIDTLLYIICWGFHALFAQLMHAYGYSLLSAYNVTVSFVYATFFLLFRALHGNSIFFTFFYLEALCYNVLLTVCMGSDFGSIMLPVCVVPLLFLATITLKKRKRYYISLIALTAATTLFTLWWAYLRNGFLSLDFLAPINRYRSLYLAHVSFIMVMLAFILFYYSIFSEVQIASSRKKAQQQAEELEFMANHDQLTGLMNRRKITSYLRCAQRKKEKDGSDFALTIFDIDGFKKINDTYGHDAGDFILQQLSATVASQLASGEQFARWGGEEFVILFPLLDAREATASAYTSYESVIAKLNSIRAHVEAQCFQWQYTDIHITLTFGVSNSKEYSDLEQLIIEADNRLLYGKQHGKNQVVQEMPATANASKAGSV